MKPVLGLMIYAAAIVFTYLVYKNSRFARFKLFIYRLFWVYKFEGSKKFYLIYAKFAAFIYIFCIPVILLEGLTRLNPVYIIFALISLILFPLAYRLVIGLHRLIFEQFEKRDIK